MKPLKSSWLFLIPALFFIHCRYNRVSVKIANKTPYNYEKLIVRFGDSLHVLKNISSGETSPHFRANSTYGRGFIKAVTKGGDTLVHPPIRRNGEKYYYHGKILVTMKLRKNEWQHDTLVLSSRRRFLF